MPSYVALFRGIMPSNPKTRNNRLVAAMKAAGCEDPRPLLASGNVVFRSKSRSTAQLERRIEEALAKELGVALDVMVRSEEQLRAMVAGDPFKGCEHGERWYLTVTFRKDDPGPIFNRLERATMNGPEFMALTEKKHGRRITTRTWNTVVKILAKIEG